MKTVSCGKYKDILCLAKKGNVKNLCTQNKGDIPLLWEYNDKAELSLFLPIEFSEEVISGDSRGYAFGTAIFGFNAAGSIKVELLKAGKVCCVSEIKTFFSGWRYIWLGVKEHFLGKPEKGMDEVRFTANGGGRLILGTLCACARMEIRWITPSPLTPQIEKPQEEERQSCTVQNAEICEKKIENSLREYITAVIEPSKNEMPLSARFESIKAECGGYNAYEMKTVCPKQLDILSENGYNKMLYVPLNRATQLLYDASAEFTKTGNKKLENDFFELLEYIITQGVSYGSTLGTHAILDYNMRPFYYAQLLMLDSIKKRNLGERLSRANRWFCHMSEKNTAVTADDWNNNAAGMLAAALCADMEERALLLSVIRDWTEQTARYAPGLMGILKEDGCTFHHCGHYPAYALGGLRGITAVIYALSGTPFEIRSETEEAIVRAYETIIFQSRKGNLPIAFSGRHPLGNQRVSEKPYNFLLKVTKRHAPRLAKKWENRCFPYACAVVHKNKDYTICAKGFSKYLWGSEIYAQNNLYGRYRSYGTVEILCGENMQESGFSHDGYDWNCFPGTTAGLQPLSKLCAKIYNLDPQSGFEEMLISDESFAGGVSDGECGMFSMRLHGHPKYDGQLRAVKSAVFCGGSVVMLGSKIHNDKEIKTVTTIFQNCINGVSFARLNERPLKSGEKLTLKRGDVITDSRKIRYLILENMQAEFFAGMQASKSSTDKSETTGCFERLYIVHNAPCGGYAYEILTAGASPVCKSAADTGGAHIVETADGKEFLAIYDAERFSGTGFIKKVSSPVIIEKAEDRLYVSNPDFGFYDTDKSQYNADGERIEVSIYSRGWLKNSAAEKTVALNTQKCEYRIKIKGGSSEMINI